MRGPGRVVGYGRVAGGGGESRSLAPSRVVQTHQGFQLAPLQRLVLVARAREAEFLQEPGEACLDHGERAEAPRPASCPAGGRPCLRISVPGKAREG